MTDSLKHISQQRKYEKSINFKSNLMIEVRNLIVDVANDTTFNIYDYFGIKIPPCLIEEWDSDTQLPFVCEVECLVSSNNRPLTCPVTKISEQYQRNHSLQQHKEGSYHNWIVHQSLHHD